MEKYPLEWGVHTDPNTDDASSIPEPSSPSTTKGYPLEFGWHVPNEPAADPQPASPSWPTLLTGRDPDTSVEPPRVMPVQYSHEATTDGPLLAQARPRPQQAPDQPVPRSQAAQARQSPSPSKTGEELTRNIEAAREKALSDVQAVLERNDREKQWNYLIQQLPTPTMPGSHIQEALPDDWRSALAKIDPRYLTWTDEAARRNSVPPELLARHFFRESRYLKTANIDPNTSLPYDRKAGGISQMFPDALAQLKIVGDKEFWSDPHRQIDAGAAYLASMYRQFGNWPEAVAAYHFGPGRMEQWRKGQGPNYENLEQRIQSEGLARFRDPSATSAQRLQYKTRLDRMTREMNQWQEMNRHLPYVFLGDPRRYD